MTTTTSFGIIGTGWRAEFFVRLAQVAPERFRVAGVVTRTASRGEAFAAKWGVPVFTSIDDLIKTRPDYVIVSVPWDASPGVIRELVQRGVRVLAETPPAPDVDGLRRLWSDVGASGLVQVAEQYPLMPGHAARRAVVAAGTIGEPTSVQISSTHLYHAVSLIRGLLGVDFSPAEVSAKAFVAPLVDPLTPAGWNRDEVAKPATTTLATIDFASQMGLYDFTDNQWWNPLRARRIVIRGSHGEIVDDQVTRMLDATTPVQSALVRRQTGLDLNLEGLDLKHISFDGTIVYNNPFRGSGIHGSGIRGSGMSDDDIAVAAIMAEMGAWARGAGPAPYSLAEGCQDHLIALAIGESVRTGQPTRTGREDWAQ